MTKIKDRSFIVKAERIRYEPPQYLVEKLGTPCDKEDLRILNKWHVVIEKEIMGWIPYNCIVKDAEGNAYLARRA